MSAHPLPRRLAAEMLGSFFLFATVIGSGIMAEALSGENTGVALLANTAATGAMLYVLIAMLGPLSGAHFNPAVSLAFAARGEMTWREAAIYGAVQLAGGVFGAFAAHLMFDLPIFQLATTARTGIGQWTGEMIATFGLVLTIFGLLRHPHRPSPQAWRCISWRHTGSPVRPASPTPRSPWPAA